MMYNKAVLKNSQPNQKGNYVGFFIQSLFL